MVEYFESILPTAEKDLGKQTLRLFKKQGMKFLLGTKLPPGIFLAFVLPFAPDSPRRYLLP